MLMFYILDVFTSFVQIRSLGMPRDGKKKLSLSLSHDGAHKSYLDSESRKETDEIIFAALSEID